MPDLFLSLHPNAVIPPSIPSEYPKWVEDQDGARVLVRSASEEAAVTGQEIETTETANAPFPLVQVPNEFTETPEKSRLQMEASNMGIQVDRRWGVKKLRQEIEAHR